jgi:hypothetical protein
VDVSSKSRNNEGPRGIATRKLLLGVLALLLSLLLAATADAYVALPSGVTPVVTPPAGGGMVELSNGEYGLYGPGGEDAQVLRLYSSSDEAAIMRRATGLEIDSGVTGQDASTVAGSYVGRRRSRRRHALRTRGRRLR